MCTCRIAFWTGYHPVSGAAAAAAAKVAVVPGQQPLPLPLGHAVEVGIDKLGELRVLADPPLPQTASFALSAMTVTTGRDAPSPSGAPSPSAAAAAASGRQADKTASTAIAAGSASGAPLPSATAAAEAKAASRHPADKPAAAAGTAVAAVVRASGDGPWEQLALDPSSGDGEALLQHVTNAASVCQLCTFLSYFSKECRCVILSFDAS